MKTPDLFLLSLMAVLFSCGDGTSKGSADQAQIKKNYNDLGVLVSEISHIDGIKHGPAKYFYENGSLQYLIPYENGKKRGESIWYYEDGNIYQTTPFRQGVEQGIRKKYYPSGRLMAEVPYNDGEQVPGMKEYEEDGDLITGYPDIVFMKPEKNSSTRYFLRFHMSNHSKKVRFRQTLIDGAGDTLMVDVPTREGVGEIPFFVAEGESSHVSIKIYAAVNTPLRNVYYTEGTYEVKIVNK